MAQASWTADRRLRWAALVCVACGPTPIDPTATPAPVVDTAEQVTCEPHAASFQLAELPTEGAAVARHLLAICSRGGARRGRWTLSYETLDGTCTSASTFDLGAPHDCGDDCTGYELVEASVMAEPDCPGATGATQQALQDATWIGYELLGGIVVLGDDETSVEADPTSFRISVDEGTSTTWLDLEGASLRPL